MFYYKSTEILINDGEEWLVQDISQDITSRGYSNNSNGYSVYDLRHSKIKMHFRTIKFKEHVESKRKCFLGFLLDRIQIKQIQRTLSEP